MLTGITLCSGGGGSALGIQAASVQLVGAIEHDSAIAAQYATNLGDHVTVAPVQDVAYSQWAGVDVLQVSPPCPNFSNAKQDGVETETDLSIARAIVRAISLIRPRVFWLENVEGYAAGQSYAMIRATLDDLDYWSHAAVVNSADFGVAQTRRRLILRAVASGLWQPFRPLPNAVPWVGWYAAIADLLDTLPASEFAPWQLARLPDLLASTLVPGANDFRPQPAEKPAITVTANAQMPRAFLVNSSNSASGAGIAVYDPTDPAPCVRTGLNHRPRAFIVDCQNSRAAAGLTIRKAGEPMFTVSASMEPRRPARAWLDCGRVVKMTPRALARFQAFPDSYALPDNNALACKCIGNAVPPLLARRITESLL